MVAFAIAAMLASCGNQRSTKLYSREGSIEVTGVAQLEEAVAAISEISRAPVRDRQNDLDGNPMYVLSNNDVVIFVRHHFGEPCDWAEGCTWDYSLSATDAELEHEAQKRLVDRAFGAISAARL